MPDKFIQCDPDMCAGQPTVVGHRLTVRDIVTDVSYGLIEQRDVAREKVVQALLYCRDQRCEMDQPLVRCWGCSKRFRDDEATFEEFLEANGYSDSSFDTPELRDEWKGQDTWIQADSAIRSLEGWSFPESYSDAIDEHPT